jgi:hypothetical protein
MRTCGDERGFVFLQGADDALESGGDVGEVGNTPTDDEDLAIGMGRAAGDQVD